VSTYETKLNLRLFNSLSRLEKALSREAISTSPFIDQVHFFFLYQGIKKTNIIWSD